MSDEPDVFINYKVHTPCKKCFFAVYENDTQTGCSIKRLDQFQEKHPKNVLSCYDNDKEFFVINNMLCLYYVAKERLPPDLDIEELKNTIRKQIKIRYHCILILHNSSEIELEDTLNSVAEQEHQPRMLTIIKLQESKIPGSEIISKFQQAYREKEFIPKWRVQNVINPALTKEDYVDISIDGTKKELYNFYCIFNTGFIIPSNFGSRLDEMVNDQFVKFLFIKPNDDGNGMVVPITVHNTYNGNSHGIYLITKVESDLCDESKILQIKDIFPESF